MSEPKSLLETVRYVADMIHPKDAELVLAHSDRFHDFFLQAAGQFEDAAATDLKAALQQALLLTISEGHFEQELASKALKK